MSLNKNKNKNKNKTFNKTGSTFPANGWDPALEAVAELPNFFEIKGWRELDIDRPPDPARTRLELAELLDKQAAMQDPGERQIRLPEIQLEAEQDTPYYQRVLTPTPSGSFAATSVLIDAMSQLGTVVGCYYKRSSCARVRLSSTRGSDPSSMFRRGPRFQAAMRYRIF
jgi:hypothetical protein